MTTTIRSLGNGQLGATEAELYSPSSAVYAIVKTITLVNTSSQEVKCDIYFKASGGTSRRITPYELELGGYRKYTIVDNVTMEAGDVIRGKASSASAVDYVISGVEDT